MRFFKYLALYTLVVFLFPFCSQSCNKNHPSQTTTQSSDSSATNPTQPTNPIPPATNPNPTPTPAPIPPNVTVDPDSKIMKFEISFTADPGSVKASIAKLKYNKKGWTSIEWDDNSPESLKGWAIMKNKSYTDGCGNKIPYTGAVAVVGKNQYLCNEIGNDPKNVTYAQMKELISAGWDIENHSYYHGPDGNCNYGYDWNKNVVELDKLIYERIGYKMNGAVVPTNYEGFPTAAKNIGYLFSTSQGTFDGFAPAGQPTWKPTSDFDLAPKTFSCFGRIFWDDWKSMETDVKTAINDLVTKYNFYFRFASHGIDEGVFMKILDYFQLMSNDRYLFLPTREIMEYRIMADLPVKYQTENNKLIVEVDATNLPERTRWRDLSFNITAGTKIASIQIISGIENISFNPETGLVNIFKQVKQWK